MELRGWRWTGTPSFYTSAERGRPEGCGSLSGQPGAGAEGPGSRDELLFRPRLVLLWKRLSLRVFGGQSKAPAAARG